MAKPNQYTDKLAELKLISEELNTMIESGSFYRLSFANRYAWIRKVKKLYNGLLGPVSPFKLRHVLAAAAVVVLGAGCSAPGSRSGGGTEPIIPGFTASATYPFAFEIVAYRASPCLVDIDNDGDLDAFIGDDQGNTVYFQNTGTASVPAFAAAVSNTFGLSNVGINASPCFVDIDNDGDLDAFIGDYYGNTFYFQNTGTAGAPAFGAAVGNPFGLTDVGSRASPDFADIDNDGDLDALIGERNGNTLYFQNTGTTSVPAFAAAVNNPFGLTDVGYFSSPCLVDIDNDGDIDALIGNSNGNTNYYMNTGTASAPAFSSVGDDPYGLANVIFGSSPCFADIDNDGDLDAFIGDYFGNTFYFQNTGTAGALAFAVAVTNPAGLADVGDRSSPSFVDMDNDGDQDVFIGALNGNKLYFQNTGTASVAAFAAAVSNPFGLTVDTGGSSSPCFVDIDNDGDFDAFIGGQNGFIRYFQNTGTALVPAFAGVVNNPFGLAAAGAYYKSPCFADIDNDGDFDAFIGEENGNTLYFQNTGTAAAPAFAASVSNPFGLSDVGRFSSPCFEDIDKDGDLDAIIGEFYGNIFYFQNTGTTSSPAFAAAVSNPAGLTNVGFFSTPCFVDIDSDGNLDCFIGNDNGSTFFCQNMGMAFAPAFVAPADNPFGLANEDRFASPCFTDIDRDGDLDAFIGELDGSIRYFQNTGTAAVPAFATAVSNPFGLFDIGSYSSPCFADIDHDGDLDAFIGERYGSTYYFQNTGTALAPAFAAAVSNPFGLNDVGSRSTPCFVDIDNDGDLDFLTGEQYGDTLYFKNTGTVAAPAFAAAASNPFGLVAVGSRSTPRFADIDRDGDLDAFIGASNGSTYYFENTGTSSAPAFAASETNPFGLVAMDRCASPCFADIDNDGDLDAFIGELAGRTFYFENTAL